jgi:hypothetical protein
MSEELKDFLAKRGPDFCDPAVWQRRDQIAVAAMQAIVSACGYQGQVHYDQWMVAANAYMLADAMIEQGRK